MRRRRRAFRGAFMRRKRRFLRRRRFRAPRHEWKYNNYSLTTGIPSTFNWTNMVQLSKGADQTQRIGTQVNIRRIDIRYVLLPNDAQIHHQPGVRLDIWRLRGNPTTIPTSLSALYDNINGTMGVPELIAIGKPTFGVQWKRIASRVRNIRPFIKSNLPLGTPNVDTEMGRQISWGKIVLKWPRGLRVTYQDAGSPAAPQANRCNQIYFNANCPDFLGVVGTDLPVLKLFWRVWFTDE